MTDNKPLGKDMQATLVYFATVTFDKEEERMNPDGSLDEANMVEEALHNVADNVRSETEYARFGYRENFEAVLITDDDIDHKTLQQLVAMELRKSYAPQKDVVESIDEDGVLVANEYDLHDWITSLLHTNSMPRELVGPDGETHFNAVTIDWQGIEPATGIPTEAEQRELQEAYDELILAIVKLDSLHHDICEYTC